MFEEDKLFDFILGLQPGAQTELREQAVKDLSSAIAAADALVDFKATSTPSPSENRQREKGRSNHRKGRTKGEVDCSDKEKEKATTPIFRYSCFLCKGPHRAAACPRREKLNAMLEDREAKEDTCQVNTLQLLGALTFVSKPSNYNLMHVAVWINEVEVFAMLHTRATNNFITTMMTTKLGLKVTKSDGSLKIVNARPVR